LHWYAHLVASQRGRTTGSLTLVQLGSPC
jgi:hypothetical protein